MMGYLCLIYYIRKMQNYYIVNVHNFNNLADMNEVETKSMTEFGSTGIEEFSINEAKVDEILGDRSYSGADLPESVVDEVAQTVLLENHNAKKFYFNTEEEAKEFQEFLSIKKIDSILEEKNVEDWNEEWKKSYAPILVTDQLEIIPSWNKDDYKSKAQNQVFIYPGMGFGTGNHETTFLCLKLLFDTNFNFPGVSCMDFGCGSGILGLALRRIQKDSLIDLYDIDQGALDNCKQNVELNDILEEGIRYQLPKHREQFFNNYDIVFANILKNVLEFESDVILSLVKPGGYLIVSGLLDGQQNDIKELYTEKCKEIKFKKELIKGDWVAVLFEREK